MARRRSYVFEEYTTDFGTKKKEMQFVLSEQFFTFDGANGLLNTIAGANGNSNFRERDTRSPTCGFQNLVDMRYVLLEAKDGSAHKIPFPLPWEEAPDALTGVGTAVNQSPEWACAHYVGERWRIVPESEFGGSYDRDRTVQDETSERYIEFVYEYEHGWKSGETSILRGRSKAVGAADLERAGELCANVLNSTVCTVRNIVEPRHLIGVAAAVDGNNFPTGELTRKMPVSDAGGVIVCANQNAGFWSCFRYKGENRRNINEFV